MANSCFSNFFVSKNCMHCEEQGFAEILHEKIK